MKEKITGAKHYTSESDVIEAFLESITELRESGVIFKETIRTYPNTNKRIVIEEYPHRFMANRICEKMSRKLNARYTQKELLQLYRRITPEIWRPRNGNFDYRLLYSRRGPRCELKLYCDSRMLKNLKEIYSINDLQSSFETLKQLLDDTEK